MTEDDNVKLTKKEQEQSFLEKLEAKTKELSATEQRIQALVERNEEIAARNLLGGKSDSVSEPPEPVGETDKEYAHRMERGQFKLGELR